MKHYCITTDLYILPAKQNERKIIYAPCIGFVSEATCQTINLLTKIEGLVPDKLTVKEKSLIDYFTKKGIINGDETFEIESKPDTPEKLTLFLTNKCNLSCRYCYAGKYQAHAKSMNLQMAIDAINNFGNVLKEQKKTKFILELHGGGEPFYEFSLLKRVIKYLKAYCQKEKLEIEATASTNGVLNKMQREWTINNMTSLLISFEVLPEIQNLHRPFPDGKNTFDCVYETIKYLDFHDFNYSIRTTVSHKNVGLMKETIDYVSQNFKPGILFFEPVNDCSASNLNHNLNCPLDLFAQNYLEAERYARQKNIKTVYSGANIEKLSPHFCYVGTSQFALTPDGYLTNCWEVTSNEHPYADTFIVGKINEAGSYEFFDEKLKYLKSLTVKNFEYCQDCFAKWHCSGDCVMRLGHNKFQDNRGNRCESTRKLMTEKLNASLDIY